MEDKKDDKIQLSEMFMAQAGVNRRFYGSIKRGYAEDGNQIVWGKILVNNGFICSMAANQDVLGARLDELVKLVLDEGLHEDEGVTSEVADTTCFLN